MGMDMTHDEEDMNIFTVYCCALTRDGPYASSFFHKDVIAYSWYCAFVSLVIASL